MPDPAAYYPPAAQADQRPSVEPYTVHRSPELLKAAEDAFRAARELEQAYRRTWGVR